LAARITVLVVDDHSIVHEGCRLLFEQAGFDVVGDANAGSDAYALYLRYRPQVVVIDLTMPGMGGSESIRRIRAQNPQARIVVFTMHDDPMIASRALRAGVVGYVTKTSAPQELVEAVRKAARGEVHLSRDVAQSIALSQFDVRRDPLEALSTREFDIFRMLAEGRSYTDIGQTLSLSHKSVANYATRIKQKLGARSLADLVRIGITSGVARQNVMAPRDGA
jgi:DNA-binding NarL/FixJ family response regulator